MKKIMIVAALTISSSVLAQNSTDSSKVLDQVVISTHKYPTKQSQTGRVVTVMDRHMLEKLSGFTTSEILNLASGTYINGANNNPGTNQRISIRGASDGNVLLLIDGVPVNDVSVISNYFDLNFIHPSTIERIEILKGGQSTLYGSDAVAGVINIIRKKPESGSPRFNVAASYGSYRTADLQLSAAGKRGKLFYQLATTHTASKGFSSAHDSTGKANFDRDGFRQHNASAEVGLQLNERLQVKTFGSRSFYLAEIDAAAFRDDKDFSAENNNTQAGAQLVWKQQSGKLQFNYHYNEVHRYYFDDSADRASFNIFSKSNYRGTSHFAEVYKNHFWKNFQLLAGADFRHHHTRQDFFSISSFGPYTQPVLNKNSNQFSSYASVVLQQKIFNMEAGGRWNHHSAYGNNFTYTFNPALMVGGKLKFYLNLSSAFKVPSLYQLYDAFAGNADLKPEESKTSEGGIEFYAQPLRLRVTAFRRQTENAIQYIITNPATFEGHYFNTNLQTNHGLETELNWRKGKWTGMANYSFIRGKTQSGYTEWGEKLSGDTTYNTLYRVPKHAANFFISFQASEVISLSTAIKIWGSRLEPVFAAAPRKLDGFHSIDLALKWKLSGRATLFADLKNLTDQTYFDVWGYNSRRLNMVAGLRFQW